jgi:ATP-dependent RNA helicase DHX29
MAKKKKTQLKPVARGFATTSVPKKVVLEEKAAVDDHTGEEEVVEEEVGPKVNGAAAQAVNDEFDPEKVEEQSLQNLVDSKQDKMTQEISRYSKNPFNVLPV